MKENFGNDYRTHLLQKHETFNTSNEVINSIIKEKINSKCKSINKVVEGELNEVYSITTEDGKEVFLRISRSNKKDAFYVEKLILDKCNSYNIPTPKVLEVGEIKLPNNDSINISIELKVKGSSIDKIPNQSKEDRDEIVYKAGMILSQINKISVDGFGPLDRKGNGKFRNIREVFLSIYNNKDKLKEIANKINIDKNTFDKALNILRNGVINYPLVSSQLVHCDFGPKHILVENKQITGIIDFELVEGGDPVRDLALWQFFHNKFSDVSNLMNGYQNKEVFTEDFNEKFNLWKIYIGLGNLLHYNKEKNNFMLEYVKKQINDDVDYYNNFLEKK